jgi:hypothetical protein
VALLGKLKQDHRKDFMSGSLTPPEKTLLKYCDNEDGELSSGQIDVCTFFAPKKRKISRRNTLKILSMGKNAEKTCAKLKKDPYLDGICKAGESTVPTIKVKKWYPDVMAPLVRRFTGGKDPARQAQAKANLKYVKNLSLDQMKAFLEKANVQTGFLETEEEYREAVENVIKAEL